MQTLAFFFIDLKGHLIQMAQRQIFLSWYYLTTYISSDFL